jgi:hypothetical protein
VKGGGPHPHQALEEVAPPLKKKQYSWKKVSRGIKKIHFSAIFRKGAKILRKIDFWAIQKFSSKWFFGEFLLLLPRRDARVMHHFEIRAKLR